MGRPKSELHTYGPSLTQTIERGDVFRKVVDGKIRILLCVGKRYHDDLSVSYLFDVTGGYKKTAIVHERTFAREASSGYRRIFKTKRKEMAWSSVKPTVSSA